MNRHILTLALLLTTAHVHSQTQPSKIEPKKEATQDSTEATIKEKTKGTLKKVGLFTLYQDTVTGSLKLYIKKQQLTKEFIYQSFSMGGPPELFLNQNMIRETWVFTIRKSFGKIEFYRENPGYYYDSTNAIAKAANVDVSPALFYSEKIAAGDSDGYLIAVDGLFLSEKLDRVKPSLPHNFPAHTILNLGTLNARNSGYLKIRSYPEIFRRRHIEPDSCL